MANVKSFFKKQFSFLVIVITIYASSTSVAFASISAKPSMKMNSAPQMINLNMQFKANNKTMTSDLAMPFYQTAALEKKFDKKNNVLIEVNPRRTKNSDEVSIEMKFYKASSSRAFAKKEIVAKLGVESRFRVKGMTVNITPVL